MNHRPERFFVILALLVFWVGCTTVETPEQVARQFWQAVARQEEDTARRYATESTRGKIDLSQGRWRGAVVTLGEIRITGDDATVETRLELPDRKGKSPIELRTVLRRQDDRWKVDYEKTMESLRARNPLSDLVKQLSRFSEQFSGDVDQALSDLEKNLPEIEKEFEALGDSVGKALEETLQQAIPELQKGIEAFTKSLEKALEDARKKKQREKDEQSGATKTI